MGLQVEVKASSQKPPQLYSNSWTNVTWEWSTLATSSCSYSSRSAKSTKGSCIDRHFSFRLVGNMVCTWGLVSEHLWVFLNGSTPSPSQVRLLASPGHISSSSCRVTFYGTQPLKCKTSLLPLASILNVFDLNLLKEISAIKWVPLRRSSTPQANWWHHHSASHLKFSELACREAPVSTTWQQSQEERRMNIAHPMTRRSAVLSLSVHRWDLDSWEMTTDLE